MALTPAEQKELDQLEADERAAQDQAEGDPIADAHIAAVSKPPKEGEETDGFSGTRAAVGMVRDTIQNIGDFAEDLGDRVERATGFPIVRFGKEADNGIVDVIAGKEAADYASRTTQLYKLPGLPGEERAGEAEKIVRSFGSYLIPYLGWAKTFNVAKAATWLGATGRAALAGAATTFTAQDPVSGNMANTLKETFGVDNAFLDSFTTDDDDDTIVARLKSATVDAGLGVLTDSVLRLGAKGIRAYKAARGESEEAKGIVEALQHDYGVKKVVETPHLPDDVVEIAPAKAADEPFDPSVHVGIDPENTPKTWEDVLSFLERHVGEAGAEQTDEAMRKALGDIANGDPDNLLSRLGIDPAKLDWDQFDNPEGVKNLHAALAEAFGKVAKVLGRSGERISEGELHIAARSLATDAEVLQALYGKTSNLPEVLMGARMLVGSHAKTLLTRAQEALDGLLKGNAGPEAWDEFLKAFHRHAFYLGSVRGAGSEIARALRSLQFIARNDANSAARYAKQLAKDSHVPDESAAAVADEQLNEVLSIDGDAEKIALLSKLLEKDGDIGALAQFVRGKAGSPLKRVDAAMKETLGNLFSMGTAAYNIKSGLTMLGFRAMGRMMAAAIRTGLGVFSKEMALQARIARADAWAYTDGIILAWKDAVANTLAVMEREGASELFVNADNLGLEKLSKRAATWGANASKKQTAVNFERVDLEHSPRQFALNPADGRRLREMIDSWDLPKLLEKGLKWYARSAGAALNATGSATRLGTILFINAPDQFIGTMAAKAGAQSAAVRQGAREAAELGIEGKALSKYLRARVSSLSTDIEGWADKAYEGGFRETVAELGEHEAREILFQDPMETKAGKAMSRAHNDIKFAHMLVAFVHTPLRIMERTAFDYTPIGLLRKRFQTAVLHGTPAQRDQALSQMALGTFGMYLGYRMAADRDIVGNDGSFVSTARLNRESYTMRIGGDVYEFKRDDPMGTILGLGADLHAYQQHSADEPEKDSKFEDLFMGGAWAVTANMLSKTWLQSLRDLAELVGAITDDQFKSGMERYIGKQGRRFTPAAGLQKGVMAVIDPYERAASSFYESALKESFGSTQLPIKRDFLGDPEEKNFGERFIGLTIKPENMEPLIKELANLSFRAPMPDRNYNGVRLNETQFNRLLELRGHEVKLDRFGGLTMKEALEELTAMPEYKSLRREAKIDQIRKITTPYSKAAKAALLAEDKQLAARVEKVKLITDGRKHGYSDEEIDQATQKLALDLGLTPDN